MESQLKCMECDHIMSNKNYAISRHVKKHDLDFNNYIRKHYILTGNTNFKKCSFCEKEALPKYKINHKEITYEIIYENGYSCNTLECKKQISLDILGIEYDPKKFEKIGSRSEYLSKLYGISIDESKKMKFDENRKDFFKSNLEGFTIKYGEDEGRVRYQKRVDSIRKKSNKYAKNLIKCSLIGFIDKHGEEVGRMKYKERCEKISYTNSLDFFIKKYGEIDGKNKYKNKLKQSKVSKKSLSIRTILNNLNIKYIQEEIIGSKQVDYYLPDYNIVIEYFGDYWHCNPKKYDKDYYNKRLKLKAFEKWEQDDNRLNQIKNHVDGIIVCWEDNIINDSILEKTINDIKNKNIIIYL